MKTVILNIDYEEGNADISYNGITMKKYGFPENESEKERFFYRGFVDVDYKNVKERIEELEESYGEIKVMLGSSFDHFFIESDKFEITESGVDGNKF